MAALSRPVAGSFNHSLIITLPGSVKAVTENLHALLNDGVILHALDLLAGGSGRAVHQQLAAAGPSVFPAQSLVTRDLPETGGGHHHHSHHHRHQHGQSAPIPRSFLSHDPSKSGMCP
jgi:gephyrin